MDEVMLGSRAIENFDSLIRKVSYFLEIWNRTDHTNFESAWLGINGETIGSYLIAVIPSALAILGVIIAVKVALRMFKKFSR